MSGGNDAIFAILVIYFFVILLSSVLSFWMNTTTGTVTIGPLKLVGDRVSSLTKSFLGAGTGLGFLVFFFTMCSSLFSGYTVSGIPAESFGRGFLSIRWILSGVPIYGMFLLLAPRLHALGKARGYLSIIEFVFDRYAVTASPIVPHALRLISLLCLQLPVFTYLITQFTGIGAEIPVYTNNAVSALGALLTAACILCILSVLGGLRGVAYTDVIQGFALLLGSFVFFCVQHVNLGGMGLVSEVTRSEAFKAASEAKFAAFNNVPNASGGWSMASTTSFVFKVTIAATMFPHLIQRLFVAKNTTVMRVGFSAMNVTFFFVQLASMISGWVAAAYFLDAPPPSAIFATVAGVVRDTGATGQFASALMMSAAVCAFMSTADSCMIAFGTMWLKDFFLPYCYPGAPQKLQVIFAKVMGIIGLAIGVFLGVMSIQAKPTPWNLSNLFSLQNVTPIHVAPSVWLGLHWKGLRGEAVLFGMLVGLGTTLGMAFDPNYNVKLFLGLEENAEGWSPALIGCAVNVAATTITGLVLEFFPALLPVSPTLPAFARPLNIGDEFGEAPGREASPVFWGGFCLLFAFMLPFYRADDFGKQDTYVGEVPTWVFTSLFVCGLLSVWVGIGYAYFWQEYTLVELPAPYPVHPDDAHRLDGAAYPSIKTKAIELVEAGPSRPPSGSTPSNPYPLHPSQQNLKNPSQQLVDLSAHQQPPLQQQYAFRPAPVPPVMPGWGGG
eukprot:CAMPEP_0173381082 /NCGR_PEP_ID=MMETSP1356-20130122/3567_1 /TAXON_ID=77927 ORGANISM="Hemiselmis virescens, Strain PCC157" /NCGR_SAMPLE_ID=MMETSP1356 /ASSEMBLY_ACC=CAM_ASM_000847 /LENGTH=723 /DNA_ID=CAMNT_0014334827 /DNA_START=229 /DNA_END=2397 /DNA_ORIENTATION=+